jgi:hypothetical protein
MPDVQKIFGLPPTPYGAITFVAPPTGPVHMGRVHPDNPKAVQVLCDKVPTGSLCRWSPDAKKVTCGRCQVFMMIDEVLALPGAI